MKNRVKSVMFMPEPDIKICVIRQNDSPVVIRDKKDKPFKLNNSIAVCVLTEKFKMKFCICDGFRWNGADIPKFLWWLGSSKDNSFLLASMVHDFMLTPANKKFIYYRLLNASISISEFRTLTSDILCFLFIKSGINPLKARIMAAFTNLYQKTINFKAWKI